MNDHVQMLPDGRAFIADKDIREWPKDMREWIYRSPLWRYDYQRLGYITCISTKLTRSS